MEVQELKHNTTGNLKSFAQANLKSGLYKILLPKGTTAWDISIQTYLVDQGCTAFLKIDSEPINYTSTTIDDTRKTLSGLVSGLTLGAYSPPNSGTIMISNTERPSKVKLDRDRWLFIYFDFPAGKALNVQSRIEVDAAAPVADEKEVIILKLMQESGLVTGLLNLTGFTEAQLVERAISSGTWVAINKFYDLIRKNVSSGGE